MAEIKRGGPLYETKSMKGWCLKVNLARYHTTPRPEAAEESCLSDKAKGLALTAGKLLGRRAAV